MLDPLTAYVHLRNAVRQTLLEGQRRIEEQKVKTYWETGRLIDRYILRHKERADYGAYVIRKLSEDLDISGRVLYQVLQFARAFPIVNCGSQLTWSHYRALSRVEDPKERARLIGKTEREQWAGHTLAAEIARRNEDDREDILKKPALKFIPKRGKLNTYQTVKTAQGLFLDLGFSTFIKRPGLDTHPHPDKYDRYLTDIWINDINLNQLLLEQGLAIPMGAMQSSLQLTSS